MIEVVVPVWWGDMDAFQHVNNTVYFRWFEHARIAFFDAIGWKADGGVGPILAKTECVFRKPVTFPDTVRVQAMAENIAEDRFSLKYEVVSERVGTCAFGSCRVIAFDYARQERATLPEHVRSALPLHVA